MNVFLSDSKYDSDNPLDIIEEIVVNNSWPHNRINENTLYVEISGQWCDYFLSLAWSQDNNILQYTCTYNMGIPPENDGSIYNLLNKINCDLCFGHFELWAEDGYIIYRNAVSSNKKNNISPDHISQIFSLSILECDKYYPTFQFLLWGDKNPKEAMAAAMLNTLGEA